MTVWEGATALVTGGGSGIGRALALAMSRRGARVVVTDINLDAARAVATACGPSASAFALDVRHAAAVQERVEATADEHGRLDYLFNNAGIAAGGDAQEIALPVWERLIDINLRGVLHGVLAAYPIMIKQGSGHIVNTASLAGLGPAPLLAPYAMTKHAVVGLSTSIRIEAKAFGVRVSVLCPAAVETPLLDSTNPQDLPDVSWRPDMRRFLTKLAGPPYPVAKLADDALRAIERNQAVIVIPGRARLAWRLGRLAPWLVETVSLGAVAAERSNKSMGNGLPRAPRPPALS